MESRDVTLSSRQMLLDIGSMSTFAKQLLARKPEYHDLLDPLIEMNYYYDDGEKLPTLKDLSSKLNIPYHKLRKQIRQIYDDLVFVQEEDQSLLFSFRKVSYCFTIKGYHDNRCIHLEADCLPVLPRIGEEVEIPFFRAYLETTWFHVEEIHHYFYDTEQEIHLSLKPGRYNRYWQYRKDKAREEEEIPWRDFIHLDDWELKRKLRIGRHRWE